MAVKAGSPGTSTARLSLTGFGPVSLWSPDSPRLYTVRATLNFPGIGRHMLSRRIGFREASFRPDGFFLNGKRLQLFGLNRHQLYPYAGMAMGARAQRKDAEILKNEFNCNMVRCSHYPQSPAFLDACDELGLLVWEEAPGWHNVSSMAAWQDAVVRDVRDMVIRDRSRPSVIIWGTRLNECKNFPGLWAATRQAARELDSTRPSSGAMAFREDRTWNEDVFAYNDYGTEDKTGNVALKPPFPGLPYLVSEAVGVEAVKPQHFSWTDPPAWLAHQAAMHGQAQSQARSNPGYAGLLAWAGFDYGSLLGPGPYDIKWAGVADGFRVPKPGAAIYQTQGDPAVRPVIVPVFFWEAGGAVPAPDQTAMIASNCERLEVFIGGTQVASAQPATGSPLYSGLAHPPFLVRLPKRLPKPAPDLLIRGFVGGQPVAQLRMSAHPGGDALAMAVDDATISADGSDATRVVFRAIDAFGNQRRYGSGAGRPDPVRARHAAGRQPLRVRPVRRARRGLDPLAGGPAGGDHADREPSAARPGRGAGQVRRGEERKRAGLMVTRRSWHLFGARNQARSGSSPAAVSVGELSPVEFIARLDQLVAVYAAAMRPPPELLAGRRTIMAGHAGNPGFRALAVTGDGTGETVGFGYGFHGAAGQWWHDTVSRALAARSGDASRRGLARRLVRGRGAARGAGPPGPRRGRRGAAAADRRAAGTDRPAVHQGRRHPSAAALPRDRLHRPADRVPLLPRRRTALRGDGRRTPAATRPPARPRPSRW